VEEQFWEGALDLSSDRILKEWIKYSRRHVIVYKFSFIRRPYSVFMQMLVWSGNSCLLQNPVAGRYWTPKNSFFNYMPFLALHPSPARAFDFIFAARSTVFFYCSSSLQHSEISFNTFFFWQLVMYTLLYAKIPVNPLKHESPLNDVQKVPASC
jgi:hypothetical protein